MDVLTSKLEALGGVAKQVPLPVLYLLALLGASQILSFVLEAVESFYRFFLRGGVNPKKYGEWAVVTGATDGIGKAYAFELARKGLNIFLISRTESKLKEVEAELKAKYSKVQVKYLSIDYGKFDQAAQDKVKAALDGLKVGVLINNVGQSYNFPVYFHELSDADVKSLIELNITSTTYMTRIVLPGMVERKKGLIVNLSSAAAKNPSPLLALYSGCKSYIELFSQSLDSEYKKQGIRVQVQTPLFVATKLAKIKKASLTTPSPSGYARAAVAFLGHEDTSSPYWTHALQLWAMSKLPKSILDSVVFGIHADLRKRGLKKQAKEGGKDK